MKTLPLPPPEMRRKLKRQADADDAKEQEKREQSFFTREYDDELEWAVWNDIHS